MKVGYVGMGIMGRPMAENLLKAGHEVYVYNRTAAKCETIAALGAVVCDCPADVAEQVEVVFINVTDTCDVEAVLFGEGGVVEEAREGMIVVDNSTISPKSTREFALRLKKECGAEYLDAPVSGGDVGAIKGTLSIMVGGKKDVFETCQPLFEILGGTINHVGEVGMGQTCKACNQLFCALHMLACSEGVALAKGAGLDPEAMIKVVSGGAGGSWALSNLGPKVVGDDMDPGFKIDLLVKDLRYAMELASEDGQPLPGTSLVQQLLSEAQNDGLGQLGTQALSKVVFGMKMPTE